MLTYNSDITLKLVQSNFLENMFFHSISCNITIKKVRVTLFIILISNFISEILTNN